MDRLISTTYLSLRHHHYHHHNRWATLEPGSEDEAADVAVAGRIMARRVFGKLAFFTLQDNTGVIQLYIDKGRLEEEFNVRGLCHEW